MISVITGDIIKSRNTKSPEQWLKVLKDTLTHLESDTKYWDIYRGDSFQIELKNTADSFIAAVYIKACIKTINGLDVRLAIGVGKKTFEGKTVTESNGEAFLFSGETLETLKKEKQNLRIKTSNNTINEELNLYFKLALIPMDHWTSNSAEIVKLSIEKPEALQETLGKTLDINQNAVSRRQKRAYLEAILELDLMYRQKLNQLQ